MSIPVDKLPTETVSGSSTVTHSGSLMAKESCHKSCEASGDDITKAAQDYLNSIEGRRDELIMVAEGNEDDIPIELQLEEVDMNDPDMDPLEWTVRKLIPIPKAYFWETGNYDLPLRTKTWHRIVGFLGRVVHFTDRIGKTVTDGMGLTRSRFSYVTSTMTEEDWERARATEAERRLRSDGTSSDGSDAAAVP